jgi:methylenetetrahydrofolate dehydrogenase (NADP+)/methenyltetrahydrofolate cyclohydrolase
MLLRRNATVTVCHTGTADLAHHTRQADILVAAAGRAGLITAEMVKPGAVVVDAGINQTDKGICGDVDFEKVQEVAGYITPVPGGVGSLTTTLILQNVLKAIALQGSG